MKAAEDKAAAANAVAVAKAALTAAEASGDAVAVTAAGKALEGAEAKVREVVRAAADKAAAASEVADLLRAAGARVPQTNSIPQKESIQQKIAQLNADLSTAKALLSNSWQGCDAGDYHETAV